MTDYRRDNLNKAQIHMPFSPGSTINTERAAQMLGCCTATVREMLETGELKGYQLRFRVPGSPWRIYKDSVLKHLNRVREEYALD